MQSMGKPTPIDESQVYACQWPQQTPFAEPALSAWNNQGYDPNLPPPMQFNGQFPPTGRRSMHPGRGKYSNFNRQSWKNGADNEEISLQQLFEDAREDLHRAEDQALAACAIKSFSSARVKVKIRGRNVITLLDTGSGTNLLERKYVHSRDLRPSQQSVRAANGTKIRIVGEATVNVPSKLRACARLFGQPLPNWSMLSIGHECHCSRDRPMRARRNKIRGNIGYSIDADWIETI